MPLLRPARKGDDTMGNLGATEIILIVLVILVFFGAKKIPELARGLGQGIREFKKATKEVSNDVEEEVKKIDETVKKS
jgi:sec-independent protein translocase protein TatA